jgi:hypothetical protein
MRIRSKYAVILAMVAMVAIAVPVLAATLGRGSISLLNPTDGSAIRDTAQMTWQYRSGSAVNAASKVGVYRSLDRVNWTLVAGNLPITAGSYSLNTADLADGAYLFRLIADGKVASGANKSIVDNTAPVVTVTKPSNGALIVDDNSVAPLSAVVAGRSTLQVAAEDGASGVASIVWSLDDTEIARGATTSYDFGANPGRHTLTATVKDRAGNEASSSVDVIALPGQNQVGQVPGLPTPPAVPSDAPTALPVPVPSDLPTTLPSLPGVPELPGIPPSPPTVPAPPASPPAVPPLPTPLPTPTI